eukprot:156708_1
MEKRTINKERHMLIVPCVNTCIKCMKEKKLVNAAKNINKCIGLLLEIFNADLFTQLNISANPAEGLQALSESMSEISGYIQNCTYGCVLFVIFSHMNTAKQEYDRYFQLMDKKIVDGKTVKEFVSFRNIVGMNVVRGFIWLGCSGDESIKAIEDNFRTNPQITTQIYDES